jgi:hypothetical protein
MDLVQQNLKDWAEIELKLFPSGTPEKCEWTNREDIVKILKIIGSFKDSNHMFYPRGGGLDIDDSNISFEPDCIEIDVGGLIDVLKPTKLIFHSFKANPRWDYFRIETKDLMPTGLYPGNYSDEEVCELSPGKYISRAHLDQGEYEGGQLPKTARLVLRHFKGSFVIFQKTSIYNHNSSTYDGRHNTMTDEEFHDYIQRIISHLKGSIWNG